MILEKALSYLQQINDKNGTDLYLTINTPPLLRHRDGKVLPIEDAPLTAEDMQSIVDSILTTQQREMFNKDLELNTSLSLSEGQRFRLNFSMQKQHPAIVARRVIADIPSLEELNLPSIYSDLAMHKRGLILVVGMTGSGKSTSIASMLHHRNQNTTGHIITIEDPIEYFHNYIQCAVTQREVGIDTHSYRDALKNALRQRPDVILVGEIRDPDVMDQALTCAETGHLCLSTIHASNAYQAVERIVNLFPEDQEGQVRLSLSTNLRAILCQRLIPSIDGGQVPAVEILLNEGLIKQLILDGETRRIVSVIEENTGIGMCSLDQSLMNLYQNGKITKEVALAYAERAGEMQIKMRNQDFDSTYSAAGSKLKMS
jgi:twitching motility protein PilU